MPERDREQANREQTPERNGFPIATPFVQQLNARVISMHESRSEIRLTVEQRHQNSFGMAHGGVLMTLLDMAMAMAAHSIATEDEAGQGMITIEMKSTFLQSSSGELSARGHCLHRTRQLAFCEGGVHDATGRLLARASGTFRYNRQHGPRAGEGSAIPKPSNPS